MTSELTVSKGKNAMQMLAQRLNVDPEALKSTLKATAFRECKTDAQFIAAVIVANTYGLNPILKEMYAFPGKSGDVIPIVSVDGWISLMRRHGDFNGVELIENEDPEGKQPGGLKSVTATIHLKSAEHPVTVTEYMAECFSPNKEPWKKWPRRMLRHKALIQGIRIAFGLAGIYDEDEGQRIVEAQNVTPITLKPETEAPQPLREDAPAATETTSDRIGVKEALGKVKDTVITQLFGVVVEHKTEEKGAKKSKLTTYDMVDKTSEDGDIMPVSMWGSALEGIAAGDTLLFESVRVSEYSGQKQFLAMKASILEKLAK